MLTAFAETQRDRQRRFALDGAHNLCDPSGSEQIVFTSLHDDCAVSKPLSLASTLDDFFVRHAVARQGAIGLPQPAIHTLPNAVTGDFNQAAQVYGIADVLAAHGVGPLV